MGQEVKELFEYINRYKPQKVDLGTKMRPFVPDFIPCVGEVDSYMKMPKPNGEKEDLGINVLDEPALDNSDPTTLTMKYIQISKKRVTQPIDVRSIELADKNPKEITRWIQNVSDLHKTRPPASVNYTKKMPDIEELMQEWPPEMEQALSITPFPGPEIEMHINDYAKLVCSMLDIPVHQTSNNRALVESVNVLFTLYSEFKANQHFQQQENQNNNNNDGIGNNDDVFAMNGGDAMQF